MEAVMASENYRDKYYEERIKNVVSDMIDPVRDDVDELQTDVKKLNFHVFGGIKKKDIPPFWKDPRTVAIVLQIALYASLAILIVAAAVTKVDIGKYIP